MKLVYKVEDQYEVDNKEKAEKLEKFIAFIEIKVLMNLKSQKLFKVYFMELIIQFILNWITIINKCTKSELD